MPRKEVKCLTDILHSRVFSNTDAVGVVAGAHDGRIFEPIAMNDCFGNCELEVAFLYNFLKNKVELLFKSENLTQLVGEIVSGCIISPLWLIRNRKRICFHLFFLR
jgi:hypothetical protein